MNHEPSTPPSTAKAANTRIRIATFLCPPLGLYLIIRSSWGLGRKLFGSLFTLIYLPLYAGLIMAFLWQFCGLHFEMRGTPVPIPTFSPAVPNFDRLEASRAKPPGTASPVPSTGGTYWTDFRGPHRDGRYDERPILTQWPATGPKLLWKQPIGGGYASFVIASGRAFTLEQRRDQEVIAAYEIDTGREAWIDAYPASFQEWMGGDGPRATPTWSDGRLYSIGALGDFRCLDAITGKLLWKHSILSENRLNNLMYGFAASPLVVGNAVIIFGGAGRSRDARTLQAYNKLTGAPLWNALDDTASYTSPMLVNLAGQRQLLVVTTSRAVGLTVEAGRELWSFPWSVQYDNEIAQPIVLATNQFLVSAGYGAGSVAAEVNRTATGFTARRLWRNTFLKNKFASSVLHDGYLYGLDEDILTCIEAATGQRKWKDGRYGYGQLLLASGNLIILCGDGDLALVRATPDHYEELARVPCLKGKTWNNPAMGDGKLLVRNAVEMACFDLNPK